MFRRPRSRAPHRAARPLARRLALAALAALGACGGARGRYVWVDQYAAAAADVGGAYVVAPGDLLNVQVYGNDRLSGRARVRADGAISLPLLNDVPVAGRTPAAVGRDLEQRLRAAELVLAPRVTVAVDEQPAVTVAVLGRVTRAGSYALPAGSGVAEALASAGGLTEFAHADRLYVLRRAAGAQAAPVRIRFTFAAVTGQSARAATFRLRAGDVLVAE